MRPLPHLLATALLGTVAVGSHAQGIPTAWQGTWTSGASRLVIDSQGFKADQQACAWAAAKPAKPAHCTAHPDLPVDRDQLVRLIDDAEVAAKAGGKPAGNTAGVQAELAEARQALRGIGKGSFDTLATTAPGQGDCARYHFLDKGLLYGVLDCSSKPQAARIKVYRKAG